jgi:hypothetical protein
MDSSRHLVAVLSPKFLTADWPRFECKSVVADDLNNTRGCVLLFSADRHSPAVGEYRGLRRCPYIHAPSRSSWPRQTGRLTSVKSALLWGE